MNTEDKIITRGIIKWSTLATLTVAAVVMLGMWGFPVYNVWQQGLKGEAQLKKAHHNRKIKVREAEAERKAKIILADGEIEKENKLALARVTRAKYLAKAEVERARGVAKANKIIGDSLKNNDAYLRYLWVQGLHDGSSEVIYVPTEANLPILEAARKFKRGS